MKIKVYNKDKLKDNQIDILTIRVKAFLINSKNQVLIVYSGGGCQLPGGHLEDGEDLKECIKREIREETGILLDTEKIDKPFFEIKHYLKNYKESGMNRVAKTLFYLIKTDKKLDINNISLTDNEKLNNFNIKYINFDDLENEVEHYAKDVNETKNVVIAREILLAFNELKKIKNS